MSEPALLIVAASARAASFSARFAGYSPIWIDQYADFDLQRHFPGRKVMASRYPQDIVNLASSLHSMPFIYTGAMENHLQVLEQLQTRHQLLGNSAEICRAVRDPQLLADCWERAGVKYPKIHGAAARVPEGTWLMKPVNGSGGQGIRIYQLETLFSEDEYYLQQYIRGESRAGVFVGNGQSSCFIGVTQQLIGEEFLNAGKYSYCGSIGPLEIDPVEDDQWRALGDSLCHSFSLKGIFCVDAIRCEDNIYPVEVNPRYSASIEVLERACDLPLLRLHHQACEGDLNFQVKTPRRTIAKAYLFADARLRSPREISSIYTDTINISETADIPMPGSIIEQGHPVMTVLAEAVDADSALEELKSRARLYYGYFDRI